MLRKYRVFIVWQDHYRTYRMRPLDATLWSQLTAWRLTTSQFSTTDFKCKGKAHSVTCHEGPEWSRGIAPLFSLSARLIIRGQLDALAALTPGKETQYPLYMRLVGPQGRSGHVQKISPPTEIRSPYRPARSESLCRLHCLGPQRQNWIEMDMREAKQWL